MLSTFSMHLTDKYMAYLKEMLRIDMPEFKELIHGNTGNIYLGKKTAIYTQSKCN